MSKTNILRGKARYAKIVGAPVKGYGTEPGDGELEWTFDLVLDQEGVDAFLKSGADKSYLRDRDGLEYVRFTRKAVKKDGESAKSISIVDAQGHKWDGKTLIGNDSELNVAFVLNEVSYKGKKKMKPAVISVQVWTLVPYKPKTAFPVKEESTTPSSSEW